MKIPHQKIKENYAKLVLSDQEKSTILKSINLYIAETPFVRSFSFNLLIKNNFMIPAIIIAILLATSGGTAVAAENASPGDLLYPVKVGVNERMMSAFALSDDAEVDAQVKFAERRLQEYNQMLSHRAWSEEKETQMLSRLDKYQERSLALIERMRDQGKTELADEKEARLEARIASFEKFIDLANEANGGDESPKMLERVRKMKGEMENRKADGPETAEGLKISAERHLRNAKEALIKLDEFVENKGDKLESNVKEYIEDNTVEAEKIIVEAESKFAAEQYAEASDLAKEAMHLVMTSRNFSEMVDKADGNLRGRSLENRGNENDDDNDDEERGLKAGRNGRD